MEQQIESTSNTVQAPSVPSEGNGCQPDIVGPPEATTLTPKQEDNLTTDGSSPLIALAPEYDEPGDFSINETKQEAIKSKDDSNMDHDDQYYNR